MSPADQIPSLPPGVLAELERTGDWISSWLSVIVGTVVVVALVALVLARRRRDRGRAAPSRRSWPLVALAAVAGVLTLALGVNTWVGYFPSVAALGIWSADNLGLGETTHIATHEIGGVRSGAVDAVHIPTPADLNLPPSTTWIYTPPGYDESRGKDGQSRSYPVVYLVHGAPGTSTDWFTAGQAAHLLDVLITSGEIEPVIAVSFDTNGNGPGGDDTGCLDSTTGGSQVSTFLNQVVIGFVDEHYATTGTRVIAGFSAGAFCALDQGLRQPSVFAGVVAIAPYFNSGSTGRSMLATPAEWAAHDVETYAPSLAPADQAVVMVLTDGGDGAAYTAKVGAMADTLRERGRTVLAYQVDGSHNWTTARSVFPASLVFVMQHLSEEKSDPAR